MLRAELVRVALAWQAQYGVAPAIASTLSECDAAILIGMPEADYCAAYANATAVRKGFDFAWRGVRYQVKANRPSGKPGSFVTLVAKASNYDWDELIWMLYDTQYNLAEAWQWSCDDYRRRFDAATRISPAHMREGRRLQQPAAPPQGVC